mmetsp:Transcript_491/g.822  ORF Transcript_491/g.822 Transcript_491/m.822 type:complete len:440 (+) Transcript_491:3-1322(+)
MDHLQNKKRKADDIIIEENDLHERETKISKEQDAELKKDEANGTSLPTSSIPAATGQQETGGFLAYSKMNPFASMLANSRNSFGSFETTFTSTTPTASSANIVPGFLRPTLNVPSPRQSPKVNPFSSPSPAHNPFVSIVETKDVLWRKINDSTESHNHSNSSQKFEFRDYGSNGDAAKNSRKNGSHDDLKSSMAAPTIMVSGSNDDKDVPTPTEVDNDVTTGEGGTAEEGECDATFTKICSLPLPENAVVVTGEENEELLLQIRAKLYRLQSLPTKPSSSSSITSTAITSSITVAPIVEIEKKEEASVDEKEEVKQPQSEWVEVGIGPLKLLKKNKEEIENSSEGGKSEGRLVMRREDKKGGLGTKLLLNVRLDKYASVERQGEKMVRLLCINHTDDTDLLKKDPVPTLKTYLLKTKTVQEAEELFTIANQQTGSLPPN